MVWVSSLWLGLVHGLLHSGLIMLTSASKVCVCGTYACGVCVHVCLVCVCVVCTVFWSIVLCTLCVLDTTVHTLYGWYTGVLSLVGVHMGLHTTPLYCTYTIELSNVQHSLSCPSGCSASATSMWWTCCCSWCRPLSAVTGP